jgi:hypothetical protein
MKYITILVMLFSLGGIVGCGTKPNNDKEIVSNNSACQEITHNVYETVMAAQKRIDHSSSEETVRRTTEEIVQFKAARKEACAMTDPDKAFDVWRVALTKAMKVEQNVVQAAEEKELDK